MHGFDIRISTGYSVHMFGMYMTQEKNMAKKTNAPEITEASVAGLTPAVSLEQFQDDVTNVFVHYVRNIGWMVDIKTAWAITNAPELEYDTDLLNPELKAADIGLTYALIKDTQFGKAMQRMYDYAYQGIVRVGEESLDYESIHTWTSALLLDVARGAVGNEWDSYGLDICDCAKRCVEVAETANARRMLEGLDGFFYFNSAPVDDYNDVDKLTVRQVALLAGMEEMSVRAAANPNRANQLKPTKTGSGTRFENTVVKEWLIQKKRYVPITKRWTASELNLAQKYSSIDDIVAGLNTRYNLLGQERGFQRLDAALAKIKVETVQFQDTYRIYLPDSKMADDNTVRGLALILDLPEDLLSLRVKEVLTAESLRGIERAIKDLVTQPK